MAIKTEVIAVETVNELRELQSSLVKMISNLGELHLRNRQTTLEQARLQLIQAQLETDFDTTDVKFKEIIDALQLQYPNGTLDLANGIVTIETAE